MSMSEWAKEKWRLLVREKDGHSGFSIQLTKSILNRLINGKPLTPIEDTEDIWENISDISCLSGEKAKYQCKRMSSLFKDVDADGTVKYYDVDRILCVDEHNPKHTYFSGKVHNVIDELFPITMPYMPDDKPIKVYCEEFLTDRKNGDFDTLGILYAIMPDGNRVDINRLFKDSESGYGWDEIDIKEYTERIKKHQERVKREMEKQMED